MMREVAIIGIGETKFGELWGRSFREIGIEAGLLAISDAKISANDIDALYIGNMSAGELIDQEHISALIADYTGLVRNHIPAVRVEAAGASGALALKEGYHAVASGLCDIAVVGGAEKMTDVGEAKIQETLSSSADREWECVFGATLPSLFAMVAQRYMHNFGATREEIASVAVKNHKNGRLNPNAHFQNEITVEQVLGAPMVSAPIGQLDCAPVSDGAAAIVLAPLDHARKFTDTPVKISGAGQASDTLALHNRRDLCTMDATVIAANRAYHQAKRGPNDIDLAEVHDSFTISEVLAIEDLRFFTKGQGARMTAEGATALNSDISINTSGGCKARGMPVGATGVAQAVEIVRQLRGEAGKRQVKDASIGLAQNVGGTGSTVLVHIFERVN